MVDFLIIFEELQYYSKNDVDKGSIPVEIYKLCSSIKETFCLSYSIRKNNNLYLLFYNNQILIKLQGNELRFLGPDERSQAILLNKAIYKTNEVNNVNRWNKSTSGIYIRKIESPLKFLFLFESLSYNKIIILNDYINNDILTIEDLKNLRNLNDYLFILPNFHKGSKVANFLDLVKKINNVKFVILPKIKSDANKILYINFIIDQQTKF
ncbi:MAG: hypothetical protein ACFFBY_13075 [Promethearchaeota archaeon]